MAKRDKVVVLAYNGIDGACAAAAALLFHPKARVLSGSARSVGAALASVVKRSPAEVHVCGLGIHCPWEEVAGALGRLRETGTQVLWHCGRGYLDSERERLTSCCTPVFMECGTNTAAIVRHFGLDAQPEAQTLMELARFDQHVPGCKPLTERSDLEAEWIDLIQASMSQYFKYQDRDPYLSVIQKLSKLALSQADLALVDAFRKTGYKHLLHGATPALRKLKERVQRCADADRPVLISGESGVGKEHVANLIHERSTRSTNPLVTVNCALYAGSGSLANSDLFGHKKGAFTGALEDRRGRFAEADGGILFLDEIGDLPLDVQAKLLRVLEDGRVTPLGAEQVERVVNVRVLAATNRDLPGMIRSGAFRADLYHRLATLRVEVPPLRERREDIRLIVEQRLVLLEQEGCNRHFGKADYEALEAYPWPGNVRQLIKVVDRAVLLDEPLSTAIEEERALGDLVPVGDKASAHGEALLPASRGEVRRMEEIQRLYAARAFELHDRNCTAAAKALGIAANTLRYTYLKES